MSEFGSVIVCISNDLLVVIKESGSNIRLHKLCGQISIPMGHIELGETAYDAIRREFEEETGGILGEVVFLGHMQLPKDSYDRADLFIFFGQMKPTSLIDPTKAGLIRLNDFLALPRDQVRVMSREAVLLYCMASLASPDGIVKNRQAIEEVALGSVSTDLLVFVRSVFRIRQTL